MRVAVYTAIYGDYDLLRSHPVVPGVDFHCFTDDPALSARQDWIVHVISSELPSRLAAKRWKVLGPQIAPLDAYEVTLWLDANCGFLSASFVEEALADLGPDGFALYRNPDLDCIYAQAISCMRGLPPEAAPVIFRRAARYYAEGYPERGGLWACGMMARRRSPRLDAAMRSWWVELSSWPVTGGPLPFGLPRDQIDLPPVLQKHAIRPTSWSHRQPDSPWWHPRPHGVHLGTCPGLRKEVEEAAREGGGWCEPDKAVQLAALVLEHRPSLVVELGVWTGGSAIPIALALRHLGAGRLLAVDAWSPDASAAGQEDVHAVWWRSVGVEGHESARRTFLGRLEKHAIGPERCEVVRGRTDEVSVPSSIDVLHHDANHGPQVVADVERWASAVRVGGILILNDLGWSGGHVRRARDRAVELGFVERRQLGSGCVMQRIGAWVPGVDS
jgi:predicted O-methyltransferase YrrM